MNFQWLRKKDNSVLINIHVVPKSSRSEITRIYNNSLKIKLNAKPQDNEANKELINFLSKNLKIPKLNIEIISGHKQKDKVVSLINCDFKKIIGIIEAEIHCKINP